MIARSWLGKLGLRRLVGVLCLIAMAGACTRGGPAGAIPPKGPAKLDQLRGWWHHDVFYEAFVRSFADSNGDGVGDLAGLTAHLDYLNDGDPRTGNDLGVDSIWLMPVYPSPSYHGYDVTDYRNINPQYGSLYDLDHLLAEAHRRGMHVILDFVLNHTSDQHPWFLSSRGSRKSPYRDYYVWKDAAPDWKRPWDGAAVWHSDLFGSYYGLFANTMPDLNLANHKVEAEMLDIMRFWLKRGVDGFRVDAARYLIEGPDGTMADYPETFALVRRIRAALAKEYPGALLVAEAWAGMREIAPYYDGGQGFDMAFSFDFSTAIQAALEQGTAGRLKGILLTTSEFLDDPTFAAPFVSNHDMVRSMRSFEGNWAKARLAFATLMAWPGTPFVYYGEEIGMQGGPSEKDEDKRTPLRWDRQAPGYGFTRAGKMWSRATEEAFGVDVETQQADPGSLWHLYQSLIALRHSRPALMAGRSDLPTIDDSDPALLAMTRSVRDQAVLFVANYSARATGPFSVSTLGKAQLLEGEGLTGDVVSHSGAVDFGGLTGYGYAFVLMDKR